MCIYVCKYLVAIETNVMFKVLYSNLTKLNNFLICLIYKKELKLCILMRIMFASRVVV